MLCTASLERQLVLLHACALCSLPGEVIHGQVWLNANDTDALHKHLPQVDLCTESLLSVLRHLACVHVMVRAYICRASVKLHHMPCMTGCISTLHASGSDMTCRVECCGGAKQWLLC